MLRRLSVVVLLSATGCFSEPEVEPSATDSAMSSATGTVGTTEVLMSTGLDASSIGSAASSGTTEDSTTEDCMDGLLGCRCDEGTCEVDAICAEGMCAPSGCGDGERVDPEGCDDGNNTPDDGCSPTCMLERECFVGHLGGAGNTTLIRAYSVLADGTMLDFADSMVPGHNPPASGAGSELSAAAVTCRSRVYVASSTGGAISSVRVTLDGVVVDESVAVPAVRELACDPDRGLLFATRFIDNGFAVDVFDIGGGELDSPFSGQFSDDTILAVRSARLGLDRATQRVLVDYVEDGSSAIPPFHIEASYANGGVAFESEGQFPLLRNDLSALLYVPTRNEILGVGAGYTDARVLYHLPIPVEGDPAPTLQEEQPWDGRRNIWPLRLSTGEAGFAMGGTTGVVLAAYSASGEVEARGQVVAAELSNTFARTAFDDTVLIVASPSGFETYDLTQQANDGSWTRLNQLGESTSGAFSSGAVVSCP